MTILDNIMKWASQIKSINVFLRKHHRLAPFMAFLKRHKTTWSPLNPTQISMTKIYVKDVVTDDATYSTINDIDIDVAADVASDRAANVRGIHHGGWRGIRHGWWHGSRRGRWCGSKHGWWHGILLEIMTHLLLGPLWNWASAMGHFSAHYNSTQIENPLNSQS